MVGTVERLSAAIGEGLSAGGVEHPREHPPSGARQSHWIPYIYGTR